ncbi:hypothetical protein [uncultured Litoreibacter sp.]|uniref:hypothetical protein n=1 Tax=uncultured Litoreibacter sp. TaxID=1392394 RepID=UPI002615A8B5|nr:hypothetical protein [uncultured Litoreibacter sp.]
METARHISAVILATALAAGPVIAETDTAGPRILTLSGSADTAQPADQTGARHGVKINRGSGFQKPVIAAAEPEEVVAKPTPQPRRKIVRRTSGW